ncbi:MAG: prepilin peptidase [Alphaproteobacteria bacterium]|nr:prepilin peptidase [Alphaproteobacteria bacterium]
MILVFVIVFCAIVALGFGAASAWSDISRLTIPNTYAISIAVAFIPAYLLITFMAPETEVFFAWKSHLIAAAIAFVITYILFHLKLMGGGDSKLLSAYALWVGLSGLMPLVFIMAVVGGILGLLTLVFKKWKPFKKTVKGSWVAKAQAGEESVPYGVAIFSGALVTFWQLGFLKPETIMALAETGTGY